ncbi:MAG: N-acetyl-gamma-glutamyl-phosphate reductase [Thermoleophilaceae bacterium]|nr:N-acetyl-gamma-glutamyl-phosphate reductase [Thermoleophilaceae bacterium]
MPRVAVLGAAGFAGALAAALVERHPRLELTTITARSDEGRRLDHIYPRHRVRRELDAYDPDRVAEQADAAIVAYPHKAAAPVVEELLNRGLKVVDLSADFRLDRERYERWYQPHPAPALLARAVYGLPELHRDAIAASDLVAGPGCYATAAILALAPLGDRIEDAIVDGKSGVSGAGRGATDSTHFVTVAENVVPYKTEGHRHRAEMEHELAIDPRALTFTPHLLPLDQGLLCSAYVRTSEDLSRADVRTLYEDFYAGERFVELSDVPPGVRDVRETNVCRIHVTTEPDSGRVLAFAAIDNLWKGAAGQGIQDLNLMLGLDEGDGLGEAA